MVWYGMVFSQNEQVGPFKTSHSFSIDSSPVFGCLQYNTSHTVLQAFLKDEFYVGLRQPRDNSAKYDQLLDEFMGAVVDMYVCMVCRYHDRKRIEFENNLVQDET